MKMIHRAGRLLSLLLLVLYLFLLANSETALAAPTKTITFSGYEWQVRTGGGGPGPNVWHKKNVWVDENGPLHLMIAYRNGLWTSAEVTLNERLGFGKYQFQVIGEIDQLDKNVVLGHFNYPTPDVGDDGTNEIDIEFARWGNAQYPNGNFTV